MQYGSNSSAAADSKYQMEVRVLSLSLPDLQKCWARIPGSECLSKWV
jgi:hypothetical protein